MSRLSEYFLIENGDKIQCILCKVNIIKRKTNAERHFASMHKAESLLSPVDKKALLEKLCPEQHSNAYAKLKASYVASFNTAKKKKKLR